MRVCLPAALIVTLIPSLAAGQTAMDDGLRALLRGDYASAVRILQPFADAPAARIPSRSSSWQSCTSQAAA